MYTDLYRRAAEFSAYGRPFAIATVVRVEGSSSAPRGSKGLIDEHGKQIAGQMIRGLQGMDGLFIYYVLFNHQLDYVELRQLVEYLIDHDIIQRQLDRKGEDAPAPG